MSIVYCGQGVVCPGLLPRQVHRRLAAVLSLPASAAVTSCDQLRAALRAGCGEDSLGLVDTLLDCWGEATLDFLLAETVPRAHKLLVTATALGLEFEAEMWEVCREAELGRPLGRGHDFLTDQATFQQRLGDTLELHSGRAATRHDRMRLTAGLVCLGRTEAAVSLLLEPDPDTGDTFAMTDQLLACLIQATAGTTASPAESIIKMVATNLVSEGKMWEGVQLLVLIGKVKEACSYLRSGGYPDQAMLVGRAVLGPADWAELVTRYADQLAAAGQLQPAVVALLAAGQHSAALRTLVAARRPDTAHRLLLLAREAGAEVEAAVEESVLTEAVRMMADLELQHGFELYCDQLGDKAAQLKTELNISASA